MKSVMVLFLIGIVGINACSVSQNLAVQHEKLTGVWYERLALGDTWMTFFNKCVKDTITVDVTTGKVDKTRSYVWKVFPWRTWNTKSSLDDKGIKWEITESGFLGIGHTTTDMAILAVDSDFVIIKTCPNSWLSADERVWVYWKTNGELGKDQLDRVQKALDDSGATYKVGDFKTVSQSNC